MAFGIGGSSSSASQRSDSQSTDFSQSSSFGASRESIAFEDLYQMLFGQAFGASANVASNIPTLRGEAATLFSGGTDFLSGLQNNPETDYLTSRLGGDDSILNEQISNLQGDLGKLFRDELLPAITDRSIQGGTLGGGRQGVAQGAAIDSILQQFTRGATSLRVGDRAQKDAAAVNLGGIRASNANVGLGSLSSIYGLAESGATADFLPVALLQQILGGPTTLTESLQGSEAVGFGQSTSTSRGKSKSGSFSFGL